MTVNLDSVFKDPLVWKDPELFKPERHLDSNNKIIKNDALTPFGMGNNIKKRVKFHIYLMKIIKNLQGSGYVRVNH